MIENELADAKIKINTTLNTTPKKEESKKKEIKKVVKGNVVTQKKSWSRRFAETFLGDDVTSVGSYIIHDVLIPAAKSTFSDIITGGIEMLLYGETKGRRTERRNGKSHVSYSSIYNGVGAYRRDETYRKKARHNFDDIVLESRGEAEEVLSYLVDLTIDYGEASIADLYDLVGENTNFTDNKYGWHDLSTARVDRVRNGYLINLPAAKVLD